VQPLKAEHPIFVTLLGILKKSESFLLGKHTRTFMSFEYNTPSTLL
jgi:hypothetical protein